MSATPPPPPTESEERIEDVDLTTEMQGSFLEYAYSVIYSRALPDARDGLKPVQRRILYQMAEMGLRPDRGHVKSARVVGEVMGKLHPHGDSPIYDALVRLAQDFSMRLPLVDGHGNFGSLDDGPAASRYTEARLAEAALALTADLDEDVVDFVPNYDNQLTQPEVLPAAFPNLLVNGASGIAVGMATNMAPHNLVEVVAAARHLIDHPDADVEELMRFVPGPDLPSGGTIVGLAGIRDAYTTGRGSFRTRARVSIENVTARKVGLVVTELPYLVGPERVIEKIKDGVTSKKLAGISDVTDLTDRKNGLRLVIGIKTGFSPQAVLDQLYRYTPLEDNFGINNVALVDGGPKTLSLRELLQVYLKHRISVVVRRSRYRLGRRRDRLHLVEGLLIAVLDIDEVIQVIRSSDDGEEARTRLREIFDLSEVQAEHILELRLRRLTKFSRLELESERDALTEEIAELETLLGSDSLIRAQVSAELAHVADRFGTPRRTLLTESDGPARPPARRSAVQLEVADSPCRVLLTATGRVLRVEAEPADMPARGDTATRRRKHDVLASSVSTTTRAHLGAVTSRGRVVRFTPVDLPSVPWSSVQPDAGVKVNDYLGIDDRSERVLALVTLDGDTPLALGTRRGTVKRVAAADLTSAKPEWELIALREEDEVVGAAPAPDESEIVFVSSDAQLLRFPAVAVRPQGRTAGGMAGIRLTADARVLFFSAVPAASEAWVATVSSNSQALPGTDPGRGKLSSFGDYPPKGRATGGVRCHALLKGEDSLAVAWVGAGPVVGSTSDGSAKSFPAEPARRDASGVPLEAVLTHLGPATS